MARDFDSNQGGMAGELEFPSVGDVLEDRYELIRRIGKGGMGTVFEAHHIPLERRVAIKLIDPGLASDTEYAQRFRREVLITKELVHSNTVRIYDFGITQGSLMYLVMEYLEGRELYDEIQEGPMTLGRVIELGRQLLDGLSEAHAMDVIHRDIKPGNIFLVRDRRGREVVKVLDFGIAKAMGGGHTSITKANELIGTARYLAPEVFLDGRASKESDIYACGLLLLEMLYGRPVVEGKSVHVLVGRHIRMPLEYPPTLEKHPLGAILRRAAAKNPDLRFPDAEAMFEALDGIPDDLRVDEVIPDGEIEAVFEKMSDFSGEGREAADEDVDIEENGGKTKTAQTKKVGGRSSSGEQGLTSRPEETTALISDYFASATQEVSQFVEMAVGDPEETVPLEPDFIERAMGSSRRLAARFGGVAPEKTVELSETMIVESIERAKRRSTKTEDEKPDITRPVPAGDGRRGAEFGTGDVSDEKTIQLSPVEDSVPPERTMELSASDLAEVRLDQGEHDESSTGSSSRVEVSEEFFEQETNVDAPHKRGRAGASAPPEGTIELGAHEIEEMYQGGQHVNRSERRHRDSQRPETSRKAMPTQAERPSKKKRQPRRPKQETVTGEATAEDDKVQSELLEHLGPLLAGAGVGVVVLVVLFALSRMLF